jgi:hypothetical protein
MSRWNRPLLAWLSAVMVASACVASASTSETSAVAVGPPPDRDQLIGVDRRVNRALFRRDTGALATLLATDYRGTWADTVLVHPSRDAVLTALGGSRAWGWRTRQGGARVEVRDTVGTAHGRILSTWTPSEINIPRTRPVERWQVYVRTYVWRDAQWWLLSSRVWAER